MTKALFIALACIVAALLTVWMIGMVKGQPVYWIDGLIVGAAGGIGAFVSQYRRRQKAR